MVQEACGPNLSIDALDLLKFVSLVLLLLTLAEFNLDGIPALGEDKQVLLGEVNACDMPGETLEGHVLQVDEPELLVEQV